MDDRISKTKRFLELHRGETPLLLPNPWDVGSARILATLGFEALATTSRGFAGTLGRLDGRVSLDEALAHSEALVAATPLPVNADLENGYARSAAGVAETVRRAAGAGLAGCSIEDYDGFESDEIYPLGVAVERVAAAAEVARASGSRIVLTARAENHLHNRGDLPDTIARLQAFQEAGADVVYAPGLSAAEDIAAVVAAVDVPVNVLLLPNGPTVPGLAALGVARVSIGGAFHAASLAALETAAREFMEHGTHGFWTQAIAGGKVARKAFS
jgi:2-methylisocitrate lyase-like PEP mutase family enzyme